MPSFICEMTDNPPPSNRSVDCPHPLHCYMDRFFFCMRMRVALRESGAFVMSMLLACTHICRRKVGGTHLPTFVGQRRERDLLTIADNLSCRSIWLVVPAVSNDERPLTMYGGMGVYIPSNYEHISGARVEFPRAGYAARRRQLRGFVSPPR